MKKVEKILAPTDLSELSRVGLEYALELARGWGAEVTVYHVANPVELAGAGEHEANRGFVIHDEDLTHVSPTRRICRGGARPRV